MAIKEMFKAVEDAFDILGPEVDRVSFEFERVPGSRDHYHFFLFVHFFGAGILNQTVVRDSADIEHALLITANQINKHLAASKAELKNLLSNLQ